MDGRRLRIALGWTIAAVPVWLAAAGCSDSVATPPDAAPARSEASWEAATPPGATGPAVRDTWAVSSVLGSRVGYTRTTEWNVDRAGRKAVWIEEVDYIEIKRFGDEARPGSRVRSLETPDGKLIEFECEMLLGTEPTRTRGRVEGDHLQLETTTLGQGGVTSIPWSAEYGGPFAEERSLRRKPMRPGEKRTVRGLAAAFGQLATVELVAKDTEAVELPTGRPDLLRIECQYQLADGTELAMTLWCDPEGEVWKVHSPGEMERVRVTEALARQGGGTDLRDLGLDLLVKIDRPLDRPHDTRRVRYRVHLADGDPAKVFVSGASQQIKSIDPHTAEVTVFALRPGQEGNPDAAADPPTDDDRRPNNMIQSDYPKIVAMASEAAGDRKEPWQVAVALEHYVSRSILKKDFSQAFATAAEVADSPVGDCTEHAVLLAALARARGIPARVAMGLVYIEGKQAFGYHMWTEVYLDGRWTGIDATLGRGGLGAAHLELAHSSLKGASAYSSFLPVVQVLGQLRVEIVEVE